MIRNKGFSLIEVVAAVTILILILSGIMGVFVQGFGIGSQSRKLVVAYNLAREKSEEKSSPNPWPPTTESRAAVSGFSGFEREVIVTRPYLGYNDLAHIRITVWWDNGSRSQVFETLKANY